MSVKITTLDVDGVKRLLEMANAEGWNPGLDDAQAFVAADSQGFLGLSVDDTLIAGISVVQYNEANSFLGLYLCEPSYRKHGFGLKLWKEGLSRVAGTTVGLDGVVEQQENYKKSGFEYAYRNIRYEGDADSARKYRDYSSFLRLATAHDIEGLLVLDAQVSGLDRSDYLKSWFTNTENRHTYVGYATGVIQGCATIRRCAVGHKIGPVIAKSKEFAEILIKGSISYSNATVATIDVPEPNEDAIQLAKNLGLKPSFETARMYLGKAPTACLSRSFGVASLELG